MFEEALHSVFKLRHFEVKISQGVFPVTTDSILLGSWVNCSSIKQAIDIGTGSGILALMIAQRSPSDSRIMALDNQLLAVNCARSNFNASPWADQFDPICMELSDMLKSNACHEGEFDLIITNPPYFNKQLVSLRNSNKVAKHQVGFSFSLLAKVAQNKLSTNGKLCCIVPYKIEPEVSKIFQKNGLYASSVLRIKHLEGHPNSLTLMEYQLKPSSPEIRNLTLFQINGKRTKDFELLTNDYYLQSQDS